MLHVDERIACCLVSRPTAAAAPTPCWQLLRLPPTHTHTIRRRRPPTLQELGGGAPSELMGELLQAKRATFGSGPGPKTGRDLSDDCKVGVAGLVATLHAPMTPMPIDAIQMVDWLDELDTEAARVGSDGEILLLCTPGGLVVCCGAPKLCRGAKKLELGRVWGRGAVSAQGWRQQQRGRGLGVEQGCGAGVWSSGCGAVQAAAAAAAAEGVRNGAGRCLLCVSGAGCWAVHAWEEE